MSEKKIVPQWAQFTFGGIAGCITSAIVHPMELAKTRMQMMGTGPKPSMVGLLATIIKTEGIGGAYAGLSASMFRQVCYTAARMGTFNSLVDLASVNGPASVPVKMVCGMFAGAIGASISTPADLVFTRMSTDSRLPPEQRRNYKNVFNAFGRIAKEEGITGLWRGVTTSISRAIVVNITQLVSYSEAKAFFLRNELLKEGFVLHLNSALISGLLTTAVSCPVDIAKTRIQNMKVIDGKPEYRGAIDVIVQIIKKEGAPALWKGAVPYYFKIGPNTLLILVIIEQLTSLYKRFAF